MKKGNQSKIIRLVVCLVILAVGIGAVLLTNLFRMEDLKKAASDKAYRRKLYCEFGLDAEAE